MKRFFKIKSLRSFAVLDIIFTLLSCKSNIKKIDEEILLPETTISTNKQEFNFGTISKLDTFRHVFSFKNTGKFPLVISNVVTGCSCTLSRWETKPVPPGHSTNISIAFKPSAKGYNLKTLALEGNIKNKFYLFRIKGVVTD